MVSNSTVHVAKLHPFIFAFWNNKQWLFITLEKYGLDSELRKNKNDILRSTINLEDIFLRHEIKMANASAL